jgi:RNA polymerase sigma-70 factor (ECF subfamily)
MDNSEVQRDRVLKAALECREELMAYARSLLGNYAAAEDAVQEAMLVVVKKFEVFQEGTSMLAWCRSIVRIEVLRAKQRYQRERSLAERLLDDAIDAAFAEFHLLRQPVALCDIDFVHGFAGPYNTSRSWTFILSSMG